jgi:hypothetical protein
MIPSEMLFDLESEYTNKPQKELVEVQENTTGSTFHSAYNPDLIEKTLLNYLQKQKIKVQSNAKKYKLKLTLLTYEDGYDQKMET